MSATNEMWLEEWKDDPWWPAIEKCDRLLGALIPGYKIEQIKSKFGELRYYISLPEGVVYGEPVAEISHAIIAEAERECRYADGYMCMWTKEPEEE